MREIIKVICIKTHVMRSNGLGVIKDQEYYAAIITSSKMKEYEDYYYIYDKKECMWQDFIILAPKEDFITPAEYREKRINDLFK